MPDVDIPFPKPVAIARRNFWRKRAIREWQAQISGQPAPAPQSDDELMINSRQVRDMFGGVSDMWLWRRLGCSGKTTDAA